MQEIDLRVEEEEEGFVLPDAQVQQPKKETQEFAGTAHQN